MRILLVEDDATLGEGLQTGLRRAGFAVEWLQDGQTADAALHTESFAALVLDLGLPRLSGLDLLHRLRSRGDSTPTLLLTARDHVDDRIRGLDGGADDYVVKPVAIGELAARIRALVRRSQGVAGAQLAAAGITLDPASRLVRAHGEPVELSPREFAVLQELLLHAGRVLTRQQLESRLYEWDQSLESNAIEVHVHHLRRKLGASVITTVRGVGYLIPRPEPDIDG
ncbi:MAG: response regulator [Proteobacteria bacterium]|nr:response regulator [Pseudomonadota bacterium]